MTIPILEIQRRSIDQIKTRWGLLVGGAALLTALSGVLGSIASGLGSAVSGFGSLFSMFTSLARGQLPTELNDGLSLLFLLSTMPVALTLGLIAGVAEQALVAPLAQGYRRMALKISRGFEASINELFAAFSSFWRYAGAVLWVTLWTGLWSLLFIIPGIIKGLSYSQTLWLVAEYPDLSIRDAMRLSIRMTEGYKGDIFVAQLLLFAWNLINLVLICTFVGPLVYMILWMLPLEYMLMSGIYQYILSSALSRGVVSPEQLGRPDAALRM